MITILAILYFLYINIMALYVGAEIGDVILEMKKPNYELPVFSVLAIIAGLLILLRFTLSL